MQTGTIVTPRPPESAEPILIRQVENLRAQAEDFTRRDPVKALLIALGAGLLVGKLIHLLTTRPKRERSPRQEED